MVASNFIALGQLKENQAHGLSINWVEDGTIRVSLNKNGKTLSGISWNTKDWTEVNSENKEVILSVFSIDDFRR